MACNASIGTLGAEAFKPVFIPASVRTHGVSVVAIPASEGGRFNLIHRLTKLTFSILHRKKLQGIYPQEKSQHSPAWFLSVFISCPVELRKRVFCEPDQSPPDPGALRRMRASECARAVGWQDLAIAEVI